LRRIVSVIASSKTKITISMHIVKKLPTKATILHILQVPDIITCHNHELPLLRSSLIRLFVPPLRLILFLLEFPPPTMAPTHIHILLGQVVVLTYAATPEQQHTSMFYSAGDIDSRS